MNIKLIADSTCDLSPELLEKYNVTMVPLIVVKNNQEFIDGETITPSDIFSHVASGGSLCSTAARSVVVYQETFAKFAKDYDAIIHINIGAEFSSSYQNACIAAEEFDNVRVVDSRNLSVGQGFLVLKAYELAKTASSVDEICEKLNEIAEKVETSFVLDRLDYMVKGGRCSSTAALGANLLNLKPCIDLKNGKMGVGKKYRGHYDKCLTSYVKDRLAGRTDIDTDTLFLVHTDVAQSSIDAVYAAIGQYGQFRNIYEVTAGCTISCHCGPGTLGIIFLRK